MFIIGTSGVGKSVTIKHLVGLLRPDGGEILLDGKRVDSLAERALYPMRKRCAMVFQHSTLFDSMTLARERRAAAAQAPAAVASAPPRPRRCARLEQVHMREFADRYPGRARRRHAQARRDRARAHARPEYVLFDEPTTGLDPVSARRIDRLIRELADELGVTAIVVSHDLTSIFAIADRIAMLYQGVVHVVGTPAELRASTDPVVQQFINGRSRRADGDAGVLMEASTQ